MSTMSYCGCLGMHAALICACRSSFRLDPAALGATVNVSSVKSYGVVTCLALVGYYHALLLYFECPSGFQVSTECTGELRVP